MKNLEPFLLFAERDVKVASPFAAWRFALATLGIIIPALLALLYGVRGDLRFAMNTNGTFIVVLLVLPMVTLPFLMGAGSEARRWFRIVAGFVAFLLALAIFISPTPPSASMIMPEPPNCIFLGFLSISLVFFGARFLLDRWGPLPSRFWRVTLACLAATSGLLTLYVVCPEREWVHIFVAHLAQSLFVILFAFILAEKAYHIKVSKLFAAGRGKENV